MMTDRFAIWRFQDVDGAYVPKKLLNMERMLRLLMGVSLAEDMPENLQFSADPNYPNDHLMLDCFGNAQSVIPISAKLKAFLESKEIPKLEFVPVDMLSHDGGVIAQYFLLHSVEVIDAIDQEQTELEVDDLNEEMYESVDDLVLLEDCVPDHIQIFRVKGLYDVTCISKELAREIDEQGFTGVSWKEISAYSC